MIGTGLLRKYRWLLPLMTMVSGSILASSLLNGSPVLRYLGSLGLGVSAFAWGYSKRAFDFPAWPPLAHLQRRQYRETWDALATSAAVDASETRLRASAAEPVHDIMALVSPGPSDDVLEIACGMGRIGLPIAPLVRSWTGADISPNMLERAAERLRGLPNVRLHQLDGHGLQGLPDSSFDVVYCVNVLPHLEEPDRWEYVRESFRVLRPGGRILIDGLDLTSGAGWATFSSNADQFKDFDRPPYMPRFSTAEELLTYVRRAGFQQAQAHHERPPSVMVTGVK